MKKIMIFLIVAVLFFTGLFLAKNVIAKLCVINAVKAMTGLQLTIDRVDIGIMNSFVSLNGMRISNPRGFKDDVMADFPEIYAHYNLGDFFKGISHLYEIRIDLKAATIVKNEKNQVNIESLKAFSPKAGAAPLRMQIDTLDLKIGTVAYKDYAASPPAVREFNVNINERFKDIDGPEKLVKLIIVRALAKTDIAALTGVKLDELEKQVSGVLIQQTKGALERIEQKATDAIKKIFEPAQ